MHRSIILLLLIFTLFVGMAFAEEKVKMISESDSGKTIEIKAGEKATLSLPMSAGTGYLWQLEPNDSKSIEIGKREVVDQKKDPMVVGGPLLVQWPILAKEKGTVMIKAALLRSWEKDKPAKTFQVTIEVK